MVAELSNDEVSILEAMWTLKALADRSVSVGQLLASIRDLPRKEIVDGLKHLEAREMVETKTGAKHELFALTSLGAACVRQLLERQLGDLTRSA